MSVMDIAMFCNLTNKGAAKIVANAKATHGAQAFAVYANTLYPIGAPSFQCPAFVFNSVIAGLFSFAAACFHLLQCGGNSLTSLAGKSAARPLARYSLWRAATLFITQGNHYVKSNKAAIA